MAPLLIAHRGASGYRPEHTLAAYELALDMGADCIEPDLVPTRDGVLVARHENEISGTTDIATRPEFAGRRTTKAIDGQEVTGWFTEDLTLAELKTLRARERLPALRTANTAYDGRFEVPTLDEIIGLAQRYERDHPGRRVGLYPETKHPSYFRALGLPLEETLVRALHGAGYADMSAPVFIQSFEPSSLRRLKSLTSVRLVQLIDAAGGPEGEAGLTYQAMASPAGLRGIAGYAGAIGVHKDLVIPRDGAGRLGAATSLARAAHAAGLDVHAWTFRAENAFLPSDCRSNEDDAALGDLAAELRRFVEAGVDGFFCEHPDIAAPALR